MDVSNRNTALASALVQELARAGVEHACVSPGSRSAPLALALWNEPGIHVWSHVDERCAGFFALGVAQRTGRPAVVLTTSGTAGANVHPAVAEADQARVPMIVITADRPPELRDRGAGQTIDQLKLYGSAARWFCELGVARADDDGLLHYRSTGARAFAEASGRPPGPVHLNVAIQEPLAPVALVGDVTATTALALEGRSGAPLTAVERVPLSPTRALVDSIATAIDGAPRGLVVAGRQRDPGLAAVVSELARAAGYPLLAEPTSQLRCGPHDRANLVATYDAFLRSAPAGLEPELVLRFGDMPTSKALRVWLAASGDCRQIVVDPDGAWNEPTRIAERIVRADAALLSHSLAPALRPRAGGEWLERWSDCARATEHVIHDFLDGLGEELFEPRVYRELAPLLPAGSTVYVASSMPVRDVETFFPSTATPLRFLANRGANGIDGLVSSSLGAAAAGGTERTFVLVGDVGLYHDMNALLTIPRLGVEATIVVLDNGGGAIFDFLPIAEHAAGYEELFATPTGLDLARVADLYGLPFTRVGQYAELREAIAGPGLVQVPLDRARNVELHRALFEQVGDACDAAVAA